MRKQVHGSASTGAGAGAGAGMTRQRVEARTSRRGAKRANTESHSTHAPPPAPALNVPAAQATHAAPAPAVPSSSPLPPPAPAYPAMHSHAVAPLKEVACAEQGWHVVAAWPLAVQPNVGHRCIRASGALGAHGGAGFAWLGWSAVSVHGGPTFAPPISHASSIQPSITHHPVLRGRAVARLPLAHDRAPVGRLHGHAPALHGWG